jgi:Big-like domain-containing protein
VTWTVPPAAGLAGTWQSLDLEADPDEPVLWTGTMTLPVGLNPANIRFVVQAVNGVGRVKIDDNVGAFYQPGSIPGQQEPGAGAPDPTAITFTTAPPSSVAFGSRFTVVARLASGGTPVPGELVRIGFGSAGVPDSTNSSGEASVSLGASLSPGTYVVTASFAGDATHAPSDAVQTVQVTQRPTTLALTGTLLSSNPLTATLTADPVPGSASAALNQRNVFLVIKGGPLTQVYSSKTDPKGRVQLPDSLLATLPPRIYTVDAYFNGATLPGPVVVAADDVDYAHAEAHQTIDSWLGSAFSGFVGMSNPPVFNNGKAGSAMPIKFSLGANRGLAIFATGYPKVGTVPCGSPNATPTGLVVADSNGLKIDTKNNQYTWDWKTGSWKGTCRALIIRFADGTEKKLLFRF